MRICFVMLLSLSMLLGTGIPLVYASDGDTQDKEEDTKKGEDDIEAIRRAAAEEADKEAEGEDQSDEDAVFASGGLGLQKLNPEIGVTGDMLSAWQSGDEERPDSDTVFRSLGIHFEAYLDPYSRFKAAIPISSAGVELGEAYYTRFGVVGSTNLTLGKFRQQFGVVNRWHLHALDTFDFPLALKSIFGDEGLNQVGLSLESSASTGAIHHGLIAQVTKADNQQVFAGNLENKPSLLVHYKMYFDLSPSTYLQLGGSGLLGWNDTWETSAGTIENTQTAQVYGVDLSLLWEPTSNMRYRNFEWRSEAYVGDKGIVIPDASGTDRIRPWGLYSLMQSRVSRTIELGVRYDYYQPDVKDYASVSEDLSLGPWVSDSSGAYRQAATAWITWWQSPFVKFRGGYKYETGDGTGPDISTVVLQMVFAAGPHKHERY